MKSPEWLEREPRRTGGLGKKETSENLVGENRELSVVPNGVTNSTIGINARVVVAGIPSKIFLGSEEEKLD